MLSEISQTQKGKFYRIPLLRTVKLREMESEGQLLVGGGNGELETESQFYKIKSVLEMNGGDSHTKVNTFDDTELYI
jgi:hypothetical protein